MINKTSPWHLKEKQLINYKLGEFWLWNTVLNIQFRFSFGILYFLIETLKNKNWEHQIITVIFKDIECLLNCGLFFWFVLELFHLFFPHVYLTHIGFRENNLRKSVWLTFSRKRKSDGSILKKILINFFILFKRPSLASK